MTTERDQDKPSDVDPVDLLRAMLAIGPEDAAEVRRDADTKATPRDDGRQPSPDAD